MTGPVNIYALSRIKDEEAFNLVKRHRSRDNDKRYTQYHEIESLRFLVDALIERGVSVSELDAFFFGYKADVRLIKNVRRCIILTNHIQILKKSRCVLAVCSCFQADIIQIR